MECYFSAIWFSVTLLLSLSLSLASVQYREVVDEETPIGTTVLQLTGMKYLEQRRQLESTLTNLSGQPIRMAAVRFRATLLRDEFLFDGTALKVHKRLDRESLCQVAELERSCPCNGLCQYTIELKAEANRHTVNILATLIINDINDHEPTFIEDGQTVTTTVLRIAENRKRQQYRLSTCAEDSDWRFGLRTLQLTEASVGGVFRLGFDSSIARCPITIDVAQSFDREQIEQYSFKILAIDAASQARTGSLVVKVLVLDENDNAPQFTNASYTIRIHEDYLNYGTQELIRVEAIDPDAGDNGRVTYRFDRPSDSFAIDPHSGLISCVKALDFESRRSHQLLVIAEDAARDSLSATTVVEVKLIDINDSPPEITLYDAELLIREPETFHVKENNKPHTIGYAIVVDRDFNGEQNLSCTVNKGIYSQRELLFALDSPETWQSGAVAYRIKQIAALDREQVGSYVTFVISCLDQQESSTPMRTFREVTVNVEDVNDNVPKFDRSEIFAEINENNNIGDFIIKLDYLDVDEIVTPVYFNAVQVEPVRLHIDQPIAIRIDSEGRVFANQQFDRENCSQYVFNVTLADDPKLMAATNETVQLTVVIGDENDCNPRFERAEYLFEHEEENYSSLPHSVGRIAANDCDSGGNGYVTLAIEQDAHVPFTIINEEIFAVRTLDREARSLYHFRVIASDNGDPVRRAYTQVTVRVTDKNDESPVFSPWQITTNVSSSAPIGTRIAVVRAQDADEPGSANARVRYAFRERSQSVSGQCGDLLQLDSVNGEVRTRTVYEPPVEGFTLRCLVEAADGGFPARTSNAFLAVFYKQPRTGTGTDTDTGTEATQSANESSLNALANSNEYSRFYALIALSASLALLAAASVVMFAALFRRHRRTGRNAAKRNPNENENESVLTSKSKSKSKLTCAQGLASGTQTHLQDFDNANGWSAKTCTTLPCACDDKKRETCVTVALLHS